MIGIHWGKCIADIESVILDNDITVRRYSHASFLPDNILILADVGQNKTKVLPQNLTDIPFVERS